MIEAPVTTVGTRRLHRRRIRSVALLVSLSLAFMASCGSDDTDGAGPAGTGDAQATLRGTLTVSAATSLTSAFEEIRSDFVDLHPDVEISLNLGASSALATQILEGAPADVFASADEANMAKLTDEDLIATDPVIFARNELIIVTQPGNPAGITSLEDLVAQADTGTISLCAPDVPCGRYADEILAEAGLTIAESSITRGQNVAATLTAVAQGDAVAGIVYVTDATAAGDTVHSVTIPADQNVIATYPVATLSGAANSALAEAFVAYLLGPDGQAVLVDHGFSPAP